jgi:hypothetical protein
MIGSFGGEGGECFLVFGRVEFHLNRSMKMKAKMVKTMGATTRVLHYLALKMEGV